MSGPEYSCEGAEWGVCGGEPHTPDCPSFAGEEIVLETTSARVSGAAFPWPGPDNEELA